MNAVALPPLTGSALLDPWRVRYRDELVHGPRAREARRPTRSETLLWAELSRSRRLWVTEHPTRYGYALDLC